MPLFPWNGSLGEMGVWGEVSERERKKGFSDGAFSRIHSTLRCPSVGRISSSYQPGTIGPSVPNISSGFGAVGRAVSRRPSIHAYGGMFGRSTPRNR